MTDKNFLEYIDSLIPNEKGCLIWGMCKTKYEKRARVRNCGRLKYAARLLWMLKRGHVDPNLEVCHKCDNPSCVNIDHLFLATHAENMQDMAIKGRAVSGICKGAEHWRSVLTPEIVKIIRASNFKRGEIGKFSKSIGIHINTVKNVYYDKSRWRHV